MSEQALPDKVLGIHQRLDNAGIPHAFGGAIALAYYAEPRATIDIDLNLFIAVDQHPTVVEAFSGLGVEAETDATALERDGQCRIWWGRTPLDLFYAYDEIHEAMARATRRVPFANEQIPILSPEHLIVCKASFDRTKDWIDIEQMLAFVDRLDVASIDADLSRIAGAADQRTLRFRELAADLGA